MPTNRDVLWMLTKQSGASDSMTGRSITIDPAMVASAVPVAAIGSLGYWTHVASAGTGGIALVGGSPGSLTTRVIPDWEPPTAAGTLLYSVLPSIGYDFLRWTGDVEYEGFWSAQYASYTKETGPCSASAEFRPKLRLKLEPRVEDGPGTPAEAGHIDAAPAQKYYTTYQTTYVKLDGIAHIGYRFGWWDGDGVAYPDRDSAPDLSAPLPLDDKENPVTLPQIWVAVRLPDATGPASSSSGSQSLNALTANSPRPGNAPTTGATAHFPFTSVNVSLYAVGGETNFQAYAERITPGGHMHGFTTGADILAALEAECAGGHVWIGHLYLFSHAWGPESAFGIEHEGGCYSTSGGFGFYGKRVNGDTATARYVTFVDGVDILESLKLLVSSNRVKFDPKKKTFMEGCRSGRIGSFAAQIWGVTKRPVIASWGASSEKENTVSPSMVTFKSVPGVFEERPTYCGWKEDGNEIGALITVPLPEPAESH